MKKILYISFLLLGIGHIKSQNLIVATTDAGGTATVLAVANSSTIELGTVAPNVTSTQIRFLNNGSTYQTYSVLRKIITLNFQASTYFCFGMSCFDSLTNTPPTSFDYVGLSPGAYNQGFMIDLHEWTLAGYSLVRYKLYNINNANDTLSFYVRYNKLLGIGVNSQVLESVSEVYPNPANSNASININVKGDADVKICIYNTLGSVIYSGSQKCMQGKNKLPIDCSALNNGMYFVTVQSGESKITKRLIINK